MPAQTHDLPRVEADSVPGRLTGGLVFLVLTTGLIIPGTLQGVYLLLALIGAGWMTWRQSWGLSRLGQAERLLIVAVLVYVSIWMGAWLAHGRSAEGAEEFTRVLRLLPMIPILIFLRRVDGLERWWWSGLIAGALLAGLYALWFVLSGQTGAHGSRVEGTTNPIYFGGFALAFALMLLPQLTGGQKADSRRVLVLLAITLALVANALSGSRGAWLAIPALLLIYPLTLGRQLRPALRLGLPPALLALSAAIIAGSVMLINDRYAETLIDLARIHQGLPSDGAIGLRLGMWQVAWQQFLEQPLLGSGPGSFGQALLSAIESGRLNAEDYAGFRHPHNQYLSVMLVAGLIGLTGLLFLLGSALWLFARRLAPGDIPGAGLAWAGLSLVCVVAVMALSESLFDRNTGLVWFALLVGIIGAQLHSGPVKTGRSGPDSVV
jgi:O-antigen ligase